LWLEVDWRKHPEARTKDILDIEEDIFIEATKNGVLISKGSWFAADDDIEPTRMFFRATFAAASNEKMAEAIERFGLSLRESFKLSSD
jgi:aromatic amino acid aminotransferase I